MRIALWIIALFAIPAVDAGQVRLFWDPPTTNEDGSCMEGEGCSNDLDQYKVRRSTIYPITLDDNVIGTVPHPGSEFIDAGLPDGLFYWAVTATDKAGNESELSNQVSTHIVNPPTAVPSVSTIVGLSATKKTAHPQ